MNKDKRDEFEIPFTENSKYINNRIKELNIKFSLDTFLTTIKVFWTFRSIYSGRQTKVDNASGDLLDLANGHWIISGTCSGTTSKGTPFSTSWGIEYYLQNDSLTWSCGNSTSTYNAVSASNSHVQLKKDINGKPQLVVVREFNVKIGDNEYIEKGSYIIFS